MDLPGDTNGYVHGAASGVDTSTSFTVAAWVYLDHTTLAAMSRVAVSQSGSIKSGFMLGYNHFATQWQFLVAKGATDDYGWSVDGSYSALNSAVLQTWVHLVGVHDAVAQTVTLYVNTVAQTSTAHTVPFKATGPLEVGRVKQFGGWQAGASPNETWGPWAGRVDEVRVFRRALTQAEINLVYNGVDTSTASTVGVPGALQGAQQGQTASTAMAFAPTASRSSYNATPFTNPTTYSVECWFRTNTAPNSAAGKGVSLISFGNSSNGNSAQFDRELFLDTTGHLGLGTSSGITGTAITSATYLDGAWHHVVGTVSPGTGLLLYVDGNQVGSASYTAPGNFTGFWRWGGDTSNATWPYDYFHVGELDEVAVYGTVLNLQQIAWHYHANH